MSEKHKAATDALDTLGTLIGEECKRDAIHLAVMPVVAGEELLPGHHVGLTDGLARASVVGEFLGIVDPFLMGKVREGERFWLFIYPRKITSLRHVWEHPGIPDEPVKEAIDMEKVRQVTAKIKYGMDSLKVSGGGKRCCR